MAAKRITIAIIVLAWVSLACNALIPGPGSESPQTQPGAGVLGGCEFLPADVPFLPDAFGAEQLQGWCGYNTREDYASVVSFYRAQLAANGWEEFRTVQNEGRLGSDAYFYWQKSGRRLSVGILQMSGSDAIVSLYPDHWINQPCNGTVDLPTPEDVPLVGNRIGFCLEEYPGAGTRDAYYRYEYTTLEDFATVEQFYRSAAPAAGWTLDRESTYDATLELVFRKPGRTATVPDAERNFVEAALETMRVQITPAAEYGDTDVLIRIDNAP